jgi:hypothetical protein
MENAYRISFNLKTLNSFETYGCFFLGEDQKFAENTFNLLLGEDNVSEQSVISLDLTKQEEGIALPVKIKHCTLEQLAVNVKVITKEVFKELNLELK